MDANAVHVSAYRRALRARNRSENTISSYEEAIRQVAEHHGGADVLDLDRGAIEDYIGTVLSQHSSNTAMTRFTALRAFYNWAVGEEYIDASPMARMRAPKITEVPVTILPDEYIVALLKACGGKDFAARRDTAIVRLFCEAGSPRVGEMAGLIMAALDLQRDMVRVHGKGDRYRDIPFGAKTGQAIDRYLVARRRHRYAASPRLWLGTRGPITKAGIQQMIEARCVQAGIPHIHPHLLRHRAAHEWYDQGGSEGDAMVLFGWTNPKMPRRYGRSAQVERAHRAARRATIGDRL